VSDEPDIDVEIVPASRREEREQRRVRAGAGSRRSVLEPATGRLLETKIRFLERYAGGSEGLAELIRADVEKMLHEVFLEYIEERLREEGVDAGGRGASREIADVIDSFWRDNKADIVDTVLAGFAGHLEVMGVEKVADRFIRCWSGGDFYCRVDKQGLLEEFEDVGLEQFIRILGYLTPDLLDLIRYVVAEAGVSSTH